MPKPTPKNVSKAHRAKGDRTMEIYWDLPENSNGIIKYYAHDGEYGVGEVSHINGKWVVITYDDNKHELVKSLAAGKRRLKELTHA